MNESPLLPDQDPRAGRWGYALALLVLVGSLALVLLAWRNAREGEQRLARQEFAAIAEQAASLINDRFERHQFVLRGAVALFDVFTRPTPTQWRAYADGLQLRSQVPAVDGLGYAAYVTPAGLSALQLDMRAWGFGLLHIRPPGVRPYYGPVLYLEPRTFDNAAAVGFDMLAEPVRASAMQAALDKGELRMSGPVAAGNAGTGHEPGLLIYAPVYRSGDRPQSLAARRMSMQGWVFLAVRGATLTRVALQPMARDFRLRIRDVSGPTPQLLYADPDYREADVATRLSHSRRLQVLGRTLQLDFIAASGGLGSMRDRFLDSMLVVGLLSCLLLFGIAWLLAGTEVRALRLAAQMSEAHRRSEQQVLALNRSLESRVALRTRELAALNQELETFAYSVSHDLRTPLRAIDGFSRILEERYHDVLDATGRDYLGRVRRGTTRMGELIEALLKMSRISRGPVAAEPVDLGALARDIVAELRVADPERRVDVRIGDHLKATGDPALLHDLLQNLIGNAWKFTQQRDDARIEFEPGTTSDAGLREFVIRDNGAGFDAEFVGKLFRPFQRLHDQQDFAGHGIGLATVKRIVERHGGGISAGGRPGEGAEFRFTLPR